MVIAKPSKSWPLAVALALCILVAYLGGFAGGFIYDDLPIVVYNDALRDLRQPGKVLFAIEGRPVASLSFALDWALFGAQPFGYHFVNTIAHIFSALFLFALIRHSLNTQPGAAPLAFCAALFWGLHPLQTEAVTYIVQRCETLMGLFFLLALYAFARSADNPKKIFWPIISIVSSALAAGSKQTAVVLPLAALLYDQCFISGSFMQALRRAPLLLAGLCSGAVLIVGFALVARSSGSYGMVSAGFGIKDLSPLAYVQSQCVVILHYLKLVLVPVGQCFDYAWPKETDLMRILPCALVLLTLLGLTCWQLAQSSPLGFWGALFFLTLAPTSSIMPIFDLACERRMYLPLAGVAVLLVLGLAALLQKLFSKPMLKAVMILFCLWGVLLGVLTAERNMYYRDPLVMWRDVVEKRPQNSHAWQAAGSLLLERLDAIAARSHLVKALELKPDFPEARGALGTALLILKDFAGAEREFRATLSTAPAHPQSLFGLVDALEGQGKKDDAFKALVNAAELQPDEPQIQSRLGDALFALGRPQDAIKAYERALNREPVPPNLFNGLGCALAASGRVQDALGAFNMAVRMNPGDADAHFNFGNALERFGKPREAADEYTLSLRLNPKNSAVANALAWLLATSPEDTVRDGKAAVFYAEKAAELTQRKQALILDTLSAAYAAAGRFEEAAKASDEALKLLPPDAPLGQDIRKHQELIKAGKPIRGN